MEQIIEIDDDQLLDNLPLMGMVSES